MIVSEESPAPRHDLALDTIICLDTSGSMRGEAFQEMKKITLDFINGNYKTYECFYVLQSY